MKRKLSKKYGYEEYFVNETRLKKLYNMYGRKHAFDKILDVLVLLAIIATVVSVFSRYVYNLSPELLIIINSISLLILAIFGLELLRNYARAKSGSDFFHHHWLDFILIMFLSFYFLFMAFIEILKVLFVDILKPLVKDTKDLKISLRMFMKE